MLNRLSTYVLTTADSWWLLKFTWLFEGSLEQTETYEFLKKKVLLLLNCNIIKPLSSYVCAGNMVLFELRSVLNTLQLFTNEWNLDVNVSKTKVVIFRNGGNYRTNEKWLYNGKNLEIVDQFVYLGVLFNYKGKFFTTQRQLAAQGR